ncbi:MAG: L-aspartate oxidase [Actinobacteria bacterium]|nr:MAG: L-aspartate oxidase [Actinomycetota bacterium]
MLDLVVLGGGVAGLTAAVNAARANQSVALVTKAGLGASATQYAQGGIAAVLKNEIDSPELHFSDTVVAGAGLCDEDALRILVTEGPDRVRDLIEMGAHFDQVNGGPALTREGGHSLPRILHAGGDATGAEIERALVAAVQATATLIRERWFVRELITENGRAAGIRALDPDGDEHEIRAKNIILATGGVGQCYSVTTNPSISTGDGIAIALRAGVAVADLEFMQFHPTALHSPLMPRPLLSEALRGEGAILRDENGVAFMASVHPLGDLAPRDVVARAVTQRSQEKKLDHLWLDARGLKDISVRFPTVWRACLSAGLDPAVDLLPVAPAAHYLSGGVCVDLDGATSLPGLWACGEVACSGVHGANRLASNSLLDGLVFGNRSVDAILAGKDAPESTGVLRGIIEMTQPYQAGNATSDDYGKPGLSTREDLQHIMTNRAGVLRDADSLNQALFELDALTPHGPEVDNLWKVSRALVQSALKREESRGTHNRLDFPAPHPEFLGRFVLAAGRDPEFVPLAKSVAV